MKNAIKIKTERAKAPYDLSASRFFGSPVVPKEWSCDFDDDEIFFCQIRLSDVSELDSHKRLPKQGYLYVFLHTDGANLRPDVRYFDGNPLYVIDDFNSEVEGFSHLTDSYLMHFSKTEDSEDGTRLFGVPSDWSYAEKSPRLLMQFDPLDNDMGFLDSLDGYIYLFFGKNEKDLSAVTLLAEFS